MKASMQEIKPLQSLRSLTIDAFNEDSRVEGTYYEGPLCKLVSLLCPHVERIVCPLPAHETGKFPPSLVHLHITEIRNSCLESLWHLCKAIGSGMYPALRSLVLDIDWEETLDSIWEMFWRPTRHANRCNYCSLLENTEAGDSDESDYDEDLLDDDAVERSMFEYFYDELCSTLDKAHIEYKFTPFPVRRPYFQSTLLCYCRYGTPRWMPEQNRLTLCACRREPKVAPRHPPISKTYKQHKLEADVNGQIVLGGWADISIGCSRLPFNACFQGSFPQRWEPGTMELWEKLVELYCGPASKSYITFNLRSRERLPAES